MKAINFVELPNGWLTLLKHFSLIFHSDIAETWEYNGHEIWLQSFTSPYTGCPSVTLKPGYFSISSIVGTSLVAGLLIEIITLGQERSFKVLVFLLLFHHPELL